MGVKHINFAVTEAHHEQLVAIKGSRSWEEAIIEEFGVADPETEDSA